VTPATLIIRADANAAIGTGHVMRCLSLAEAWIAHGGRVLFLSACENESLAQRISNTGAEMARLCGAPQSPDDIAQTRQVLNQHPHSALLLDGYGFDAAYQDAVREDAVRKDAALVVLDDFAHLPRYSADIIINQNLGAESFHYTCLPKTKLLLGTDYVLLRSEFTSRREVRGETALQATRVPARRVFADGVFAARVLVTLGGSDPSNATLNVVHALKRIGHPDIEAVIVVGAANPHRAEIEAELADGPCGVHLRTDVRDMAELMAWADVAVSAGGTTCWELAFMGLPNAIIVLADNQRAIARELDAAGVSVLLGEADAVSVDSIAQGLDALMHDVEMREAMSARGRALVDGNGARRVVEAIRASIGTSGARD